MPRLDKLRELLAENEAVYITAYPDIFYYSNFQSEDARLIISKDKAILITDSRYTIQAKLQSPEFDVYDIRNGIAGAFELVKSEVVGYEEEHICVAALERVKNAVSDREFKPMQKLICGVREVKEKGEIDRIRAAERLGDEAFSYILERISAGRRERDIALELEFFMRRNGASGLSFETIVASGVRSAMPHGVASDKLIEKGDLVTLDFGCVLDGYCSDMTRTVAVGSLCEKGRLIYDTVKTAQQAALNAVREGAELSSVDKTARDIISRAGFGENFGHSLGHSVGIEIHENPCFSPKASGVVKNGNVITVEPGIYIEGFGGVRIEDLTAVSDGKCEILSTSSKELIIV